MEQHLKYVQLLDLVTGRERFEQRHDCKFCNRLVVLVVGQFVETESRTRTLPQISAHGSDQDIGYQVGASL